MAVDYIQYFLVAVTFLCTTETYNATENDTDVRSHLKLEIIQKYCTHRDAACEANKVKICAVRMVNESKHYKDFLNDCYLFLSNMCDYPGEEYYLVSDTSCEKYLARRRSNTTTTTNSTKPKSAHRKKSVKVHKGLRNGGNEDESSDEDHQAYDGHWCPTTCPDAYNPECMIINRQAGGKDLRMYYFNNHCLADAYYCTYWETLPKPDDEDSPEVRHSPISWTSCASSRFIQFSRFAEAASSMAHYGWLAGPYKATHIVEPHQRIPGFG
ncbi:hypothetical protein PYW08_012157 [Mythimna loreyi]|uniref:Uncharacterized protein n=1 Tax=Mythimna loreyi TaxID=667449 RepID=A0ACC2Q182_9NEOP|nr:hypothetical protein PYW08_012157 [Mythimna loreyi]